MATYDDGRYVSYPNSPCPIEVTGQTLCNLSGARLPGLSTWAASSGGEIKRPVGQFRSHDAELYLGGDYSYRSSFYTTSTLSTYSLVSGYSLVNLRAGIRALDGLLNVQLWGRNVFNAHYDLTRSAANTGAVTYSPGDPATFGLTIRTKL